MKVSAERATSLTSVRTLAAKVYERCGNLEAALDVAEAEAQESTKVILSRVEALRVLGRCAAARKDWNQFPSRCLCTMETTEWMHVEFSDHQPYCSQRSVAMGSPSW